MNLRERKPPRIHIYTGNHGTKAGIEEYIAMLRAIFMRKGWESEESPVLVPNEVNIIIDEFTNYVENRNLLELKKAFPATRYIYVLTEFLERRYLVRSTNNFNGLFEAASISILNVLIRLRRSDFGSARLSDWAMAVIYLPLFCFNTLVYVLAYAFLRFLGRSNAPAVLNRFRKRLHRLAYYHARFLGLEQFHPYADAVITSHEGILPGLIAAGWLKHGDARYKGVLYPEFDREFVLANIFRNKSMGIEITGTITRFRKRYVRKINTLIETYGLYHSIGHVRKLAFCSAVGGPRSKARAAFSLHPPQTKNWRYSSPTRLFRALQADGNIPIITHYFGQNPIEDVCLRFKSEETLLRMAKYFASKDAAVAFLEPKIEKYNTIARNENDQLLEKISSVLLPGTNIHS